LLFSLDGLPDPWAVRVGGERKMEYQPLRLLASESAV